MRFGRRRPSRRNAIEQFPMFLLRARLDPSPERANW
jgi:hypothetical protein